MNWRDDRGYRGWDPYVPVAKRKADGLKKAKKLLGKGETLAPIEKFSSRKMAATFWGLAWCDYMETYSDYANRLPRGRTYARNGSIVDLRITTGKVTAMVCGSDLYRITITIDKIGNKPWQAICSDCSKSIHSVIDLMRGKLSDEVIARLTDPKSGMFPSRSEIKLRCSCPDGAALCKHLAAVLYGVGKRLDTQPELLSALRGVDGADLVSEAMAGESSRPIERIESIIGHRQ
ncbi:MAG: SWIM zinc finger family protein [Pirellulaceae bacterium]